MQTNQLRRSRSWSAKPTISDPDPAHSTVELLRRVREGDTPAADELFQRIIPLLRRWARGRLPAQARELVDTDDLVQDTLAAALRNLDEFEPKNSGALLAYLRLGLMNRVRDEVRRARRRGAAIELPRSEGRALSPLEQLLGKAEVIHYENALRRLRTEDREAILWRIEGQCSYEELAVAMGKPSPNAARVAVRRALTRLAKEMSAEQPSAEPVALSGSVAPTVPADREQAREVSKYAAEVADGSNVDWDSIEASTKVPARQEMLRQFRTVASIAEAHRASSLTRGLQPAPGQDRALNPGDGWGQLVIVEEIGTGSYSRVYRARDPWLSHEVALKLIDARTAADSAKPLLYEAWALARVRDPNIVSVYGADVDEGRIGIWMELVAGPTLDELIKSKGPLPWHEAVEIGRQISRAVAAVHDAGLVHGDVTARNVVLSDGNRAVLMDFGASHVRDSITSTGRVTGTPLYLAPEVLNGQRSNILSDVYAIGVLLYYLVTGEYPVRGSSIDELKQQHRNARIHELSTANPEVTPEFARIIHTALAPVPGNRFADSRALEQALAETVRQVRTSPLNATLGNLSEFNARATPALKSRDWLLDTIATRVIRLQTTLQLDRLENEFGSIEWSFDLTPFLSADADAESLAFLALYPSGRVRSMGLIVSNTDSNYIATLVNPLSLIDPGYEVQDQDELPCDLEIVGISYPSDGPHS